MQPGDEFSGSNGLVHLGPPPAYTLHLPPSPAIYTAQAIIPLGYIPPLTDEHLGSHVPIPYRTACPHGHVVPSNLAQSCPPDAVYLYYSKPVTFTVP
ncbi:MAG: hypothetical protein ACYDGY_09685 [Acidimicrobiales bacterium]